MGGCGSEGWAGVGELEALHSLRDSDPRLVVVHNEGVTSKASNLNAVLHLTELHEYCLILDADHHATSDFVTRLLVALQAASPTTLAMQGSVLTRGDTCWEHTLCALNW